MDYSESRQLTLIPGSEKNKRLLTNYKNMFYKKISNSNGIKYLKTEINYADDSTRKDVRNL